MIYAPSLLCFTDLAQMVQHMNFHQILSRESLVWTVNAVSIWSEYCTAVLETLHPKTPNNLFYIFTNTDLR